MLIGLNLHARMPFPVRLFHNIHVNDMLLRLYCLYKKSPRKCRELCDLVKEVFKFPNGGNLPVQAHESRWITYQ